jgi:hypothetical protein
MVPVTLSTAVRAGLLALLLGLAAALTAPAARGAAPVPAGAPVAAAAPLDEDWSWREFVKYWERHTIGRTSGIIGIVLLVATGAVLIILSKSRY